MKLLDINKHIGVLACLLLLISFDVHSTSVDVGGIYISGFVTNASDNKSVEDVIIVITHEHERIYSLRSKQNGWFEISSPLGKEYIGKTVYIDVFKRGYIPKRNIALTVNKNKNNIDVKIQPMEGFYVEENDEEYLNRVRYGYVYDEDTLKPVKGAVITVSDQNAELPIASAVTRNSGYFSIYYQNKNDYAGKVFNYSVEHYEHNTDEDKIKLDSVPELFEVGLKQNSYRFSLGPAFHVQTTDERSDKESGGAILLNLTWHHKKLIVVNDYLPRYKKSGFIGLDFSVGTVPFRKTSEGADEVDFIKLLGVGMSFAIKEFLLPVRIGVTHSDTDKTAVYLGVNIPLYYF